MGKQLVAPKTQLQSEDLVIREQKNWGRFIGDIPASDIGPTDLSYLENMHSYPEYLEGRTGSRLFSELQLPTLIDGIRAYKELVDGQWTVTATTPIFTASMVFNRYIVWPDGDNDEIIAFNSTTSVVVRDAGAKGITSGCSIRGRVFGNHYHKASKRILLHIDTRLFYANWFLDEWVQVYGQSSEIPSESWTFFSEDEDYIYGMNRNGVFKTAITEGNPYFYKINSPVPDVLITGVEQTEDLTIGRRYIYGMTKLKGNYLNTRTGDNADENINLGVIEQESGTTAVNDDYKDYGEVFTEELIGLGNETYGVLTCDVGGVGINEDLEDWRLIQDGTFNIEMNGQGAQTIACDFSNIFVLDDVRATIENGIRVYWPTATVEIVRMSTGRARFVISTGKINGSTISFVSTDPGGVGTDISNVDANDCGLRGTAALGELDNTLNYTEPSTVGTLTPATVRNTTPSEVQRHFTHYSVYGTLDSGPAGTDVINGRGNNPEQFIWLYDHPVIKAFTASQTEAVSPLSIIYADEGFFTQHDIGDILYYEDGSSTEIEYLCDASGNRVYTPTSRWAVGDSGSVGLQSATMGTQTVLTCTKTGNTVTLVSGTRVFTGLDVRKPLFWDDGTVDWIISVTDGNTVEVLESGDKDQRGVGMDPETRSFTDVSIDEILRTRRTNFLADHRFWTALPESDIGTIVPGFIVVATSGQGTIYWSQLSIARKYRGGYHNPAFQFDDKFEDDITFLMRLPDKLAIVCSRSTWTTPTNNPIIDLVPNVGVAVALLPPAELIDNIGTNHVTSIRKIDTGQYSMVTSEPGHRIFDGFRFTENLAYKQIMRILEGLSTFGVTAYNDTSGLIIWGAEEEA